MPLSLSRAMVRSRRDPYVPIMTPPRPPLWAYTYKLVPPQSATRLKAIQALLAQEHADATTRAERWEGRLVVDERVSHILVVAESPDLDSAVNRRVEEKLRALKAEFELTVPLQMGTEPPDDTVGPRGDVVHKA